MMLCLFPVVTNGWYPKKTRQKEEHQKEYPRTLVDLAPWNCGGSWCLHRPRDGTLSHVEMGYVPHITGSQYVIIWYWWFGNMFIFPFSWEIHPPKWRTPSFFRGVGQPPTRPTRIDEIPVFLFFLPSFPHGWGWNAGKAHVCYSSIGWPWSFINSW